MLVRYIHDDSETTEDEVELRVTDGLNSKDVKLLVQVRNDIISQDPGRVTQSLIKAAASDFCFEH